MVFECLSQLQLLDLASGRMRDFADEGDVVGDLPLGDAPLEEREHLFAREFGPWLLHDHEQRAFIPLWMSAGDGRGLMYAGVSHGDVLEVDGADPFAA